MWATIFVTLAILLFFVRWMPEKIMLPFAQADGAHCRIIRCCCLYRTCAHSFFTLKKEA